MYLTSIDPSRIFSSSAIEVLRRPLESTIESFWSTMQRELLDRHAWGSKTELASAIEGWYNPRRRHSALGCLSPHEFEALHTTPLTAA